MKSYAQLSKLKNPMRNLDLVLEFIEIYGKHTLTLNGREDHYKKEFFNIDKFQLIDAKAQKSYSSLLRTDGYIKVRNNQSEHAPLYDNVYKLSYDLKTRKIRYSTIESDNLFSDLRNLFLKFILNKEMKSKLPTNENRKKLNKI